ncbi:molecular chaperone HtpG [Raineya orbicola]|uniref:Chaperone protein HtpG n=1 Tax=Raineya orbicola TaxID=2016530 RepID=A0A2N3I791_9BACT|nr:molecular chaperone HtpG [Raineya orbicola]PKQ66170.1 Molecular chaperone HSP90 family [Raineya orbicola]
MQAMKGTLSIHTDNIFPIIKKFLYSDHEIFLRELVSNGVDACQKLKALSSLGEFTGELGDLKVQISVNKDAKTITINDTGIGMTAEEIDKYINQIAFSGATEFVQKYQDKISDARNQIIGNFGLGFYSAFMVAKKVEIITKSYQTEAPAARWVCEGNTEFTIEPAEKLQRGTTIILHIAEDSEEFLDKWRLREILNKYARFLPIPVELEGEQINQTKPLWTIPPTELKDEDYLNFYKELYPLAEEPLFWIHLNVDYPFNLTGILYFPKIKNTLEVQKNKIQLYSRQVFITDEVSDIVPEFLMLLHGIIDSPDIPLNVSRSYLQADSNVKKINTYITKKVADKLAELFRNDRKSFEAKWESIGLFVKYGMLTDEKFYEKAEKFCLLKNIEGKFFTLDEYKEHTKANQTDKHSNLVWLYTNDKEKQFTYIDSARKRSYDVLIFDGILDNAFGEMLERKLEKTQVRRVDANVIDKLILKEEEHKSVLTKEEEEKVKELFKKVIANDKITIELQGLAPDEMPVLITLPEYIRRMQEMSRLQGWSWALNENNFNVTINGNHTLISKLLKENDEHKQIALASHLYDLAQLSQGILSGEKLSNFIQKSIEFLG